MDPSGIHPFLFYPQLHPPPPPPPPPPPHSSDGSFPIVAISILGILTTAVLLLSYYIFVIKCCFNWHRSDVIARLSRSRRRQHHADRHLMSVYSIDIGDNGLDESAIQAIPTHRFRKEEKNSFHECAVCLNEFQEEERIRLLPNCFHVFHIDCIDTWLQTHANCPLCRCNITSPCPCPIPTSQHPSLQPGESVVIEMRDNTEGSDQAPRTETTASNCVLDSSKKERKLHKVSSMGDECIDVRVKDEHFSVQPMRRSFSMDSSSDRQLYLAVQEILQQNPHFREACSGEGSSSGSSGRNRRSFFSFSHCRSSRSAVLPLKNEI